MKRILAVLLLLLSLAALDAARAEDKALTLMVYMCGSNLESQCAAASEDLMEMAASGYDVKRVNLLVMTGGSRRWSLDIPTDALCVYMPGRGALRMLGAFEPMSMGAPEALTALLDFGYERYPAERYALVLWDHGGGPLNGVCWDDQYDSDHLTLDELCAALEASPVPDTKLDWIGFDACLMSSVEVAGRLAPYARYMISSEETEPGAGWDYAFLGQIAEDADGAGTGRRVIDSYFEATEDDGGRTLSCVDLSRLDALRERLDAFFPDMEINGGNYARFSYAARHTRAFGRAGGDADSYDLVDLANLVEQLAPRRPDEAAQVLAALEEAVVYNRSGDGQSKGLSVYHPYANRRGYASQWSALYPELSFSGAYSDYVARFASYLFGSAAVDWTGLETVPTDDPDVFALPLSDSQLELMSGAALNVLRWDERDGAYARVAAVNRLSLEDGVLYGGVPERVLAAVDADGAPLTGAIPYQLLPDGAVGICVNYCTREAAGSAEALATVSMDVGSGDRDFGSYDFDLTETEGVSSGVATNQVAADSTGSAVPDQGEAQPGSVSLGDVLGASKVQVTAVSPIGPDEIAQTLIKPASVSFDISAVPVTAAGAGTLDLMPAETTSVDIQPVQVEGEAPEKTAVRVGKTGVKMPLDTFAVVELESFEPSQVEIDLTGLELKPAEAEEVPVVHAWLKCAVDGDGGAQVQEVWLYDAAAGIWSCRGTLDLTGYPVASFPIAWRQPTTVDGALTGYESWADCRADAATADADGLTLRFVPARPEEALCVSFQVTDAQNADHSSLPLAAE